MSGVDAAAPFTLQEVVFPEPGVSTEAQLYFRVVGEGRAHPDTGRVDLGPGARLMLDTFFNAFDAGEWRAACALETLAFGLEGAGPVRVRVFRSTPKGPKRKPRVISEEVFVTEATLAAGEAYTADLSAFLPQGGACILHVEIEARDRPVTIERGRFTTRDTPKALPRLAISITTFRREAEVEATARRLAAFLESYEHAGQTWVQVVDNGQSARIEESAHVRLFPNANLGGAGGFARGLIEARAAGATHCLFMDDDASFHMENIRRTYALLALARDPKTALAGAMITNTRKHQMFENGATFDGICRPRHMHTDLRDRKATYRMLFKATATLPDNAYGGWWYFAFPIAETRHFPFPFFVRGDDSGFSLANRFHIRTLNGVISFQDSFGEKENAQIHYLDARYHLLHHIVFPALDRGPRGNALVPLRLILRSIAKFHYESVEAQLMAIRDVLSGPDFFLENADMAARRAVLKDLAVNEVWSELRTRPTRLRRSGRLRDRLWALTLNGHLLPFHGRFGARRVIRLSMRGPLWPVWGAREIAYVNRRTGQGYRVRFDRWRGLALLWQAIGTAFSLYRRHGALLDAYRGRYDELTSEDTWKRLLNLDPHP